MNTTRSSTRKNRRLSLCAAGLALLGAAPFLSVAAQASPGIPQPICQSAPNGGFTQLDVWGNPLYWKLGTTEGGSGTYSNDPNATLINAGFPWGNAVELESASKTEFNGLAGTPSHADASAILRSDDFSLYGDKLVFDIVSGNINGIVYDEGALAYTFNVTIENLTGGFTHHQTIFSGEVVPTTPIGCNFGLGFISDVPLQNICLDLAPYGFYDTDKIRVTFTVATKVSAATKCDAAYVAAQVVIDNVSTCAFCLSHAIALDEETQIQLETAFFSVAD